MNDNRNDPAALLFTCERCGHWPMAFQEIKTYGGDASFACPRCRQTAVIRLRREGQRRELQATG